MYKLKPFEKVIVPEGYEYVPNKKVASLCKKHEKDMLCTSKENENFGDGWIDCHNMGSYINKPERTAGFFFCIKKGVI